MGIGRLSLQRAENSISVCPDDGQVASGDYVAVVFVVRNRSPICLAMVNPRQCQPSVPRPCSQFYGVVVVSLRAPPHALMGGSGHLLSC